MVPVPSVPPTEEQAPGQAPSSEGSQEAEQVPEAWGSDASLAKASSGGESRSPLESPGAGALGVRHCDAEGSSSLGLSRIHLNVVFLVLE